MDGYTHLETERDSEVLTIHLLGPNLHRSRVTTALEVELIELVESEKPIRVIVDFSRVEHCSSAVMNALLRVKRRVIDRGGSIKLCDMSQSIRAAYKLLNLDGTVFDIFDKWSEARADFQDCRNTDPSRPMPR